MSFNELAITIAAENRASAEFSKVAADASRMGASVGNSAEGFTRLEDASRRASVSLTALATKMSGVVTSGLALYSVWRSVESAQIAVAAAQKEVHESEVTLAEYQRRLNRLVAEGRAGTEEYNLILQRISVNEELLAVKKDRLAMAQRDVTRSYVYAAATVIPTVITGISSLKDVYGMLTAAKNANITASIASSAAELKAAVASKAAAAANWILNASLAMKISLLTLGVGLVAATAGYMAWLASTTRDAAAAQAEYNAQLSAMPEATASRPRSIIRAGEEELYRRGVEP